MANPVQRVRYFDGEYLQSYDFTDDQSYHIAMRRQMNVRLHLHGIVYGLAIVMDQDSVLPSGPFFFSVEPGLAIDHTGREILVPAPYSLSNVLTGPGLSPGWYEVWICYQEDQTGLPAAGYLDCNVQGQNTRYQETFQIVLNKQGNAAPACGGIRLGTVDLQTGVLGLEITNSKNLGRTYVGIRAQRLIAPDQEADQFDITAINTNVPDKILPGYLDVYPGTFHRGNVIVKKNEVIGDDFILDSSKDPNVPGSIPPTGNLKVTGDFFLKGDFFGFNSTSGHWYGLKKYIQSLMPTILADTVPISTSPQPLPSPFLSPFNISIPQSIPLTSGVPPGITNPTIVLSINGINWQDPIDLNTHWNSNPTVNGLGFGLKLSGSAFNAMTTPPTLSFNCVITPGVQVGTQIVLPITGVLVNYLVIFTP